MKNILPRLILMCRKKDHVLMKKLESKTSSSLVLSNVWPSSLLGKVDGTKCEIIEVILVFIM